MGLQTNDKSGESGSRKSSAVGLLRRVRLGPVAALAIGGATLVVAIAIGTFVSVMTFRDRALDTSKQQLDRKRITEAMCVRVRNTGQNEKTL